MNDRNSPLSQRIREILLRLPERTATSLRRRYKRTREKLSWRRLSHKLLVRTYWMRLGDLSHYSPRPVRLEEFPPLSVSKDRFPSLVLVTPSFQQKDFLISTIQSVLDQNYPKLFYIVNDGGSQDGTREVLKQFSDRLFSWSSEKDNGQADAVLRGFSKAKGEIMAWLNSDDLLLPGTLAFVGNYFAENPDVDVIYGHRILIDEKGKEIGRWILPPHDNEPLRYVDYVPQETLFWRSSLYEKVGGIDSGFHFALDWDLLLRFQNAGARIVRVPYFLGCFRIHPQQKTSSVMSTRGMAEMKQLRDREHGRNISNQEIDNVAREVQVKGALTSRLLSFGIRR